MHKSICDSSRLVVGQGYGFYVLTVMLYSDHHILVALSGHRLKRASQVNTPTITETFYGQGPKVGLLFIETGLDALTVRTFSGDGGSHAGHAGPPVLSG
jgi:hypothetical protein